MYCSYVLKNPLLNVLLILYISYLFFTKHTIELIARTDYLMANEIEVNTK